MSKMNQAVELFMEGFSCSQALLATYCQELGVKLEESLRRVSSAFGGGLAGHGDICEVVRNFDNKNNITVEKI